MNGEHAEQRFACGWSHHKRHTQPRIEHLLCTIVTRNEDFGGLKWTSPSRLAIASKSQEPNNSDQEKKNEINISYARKRTKSTPVHRVQVKLN